MSTMLYDTHMADYPIDIDMHHPEPWFDAEAKMDADVPLENHFTDHESTLSVEVDMDDHYQENEYEMGDGEGEENYEEMSSDLLDIEVYDASAPLEDATLPPAEVVNPPHSHPFDIDSLETTKPLILPVATTPAMSPLPPPDTDLPDAVAAQHVETAAEEPADEENAIVRLPAPPRLASPLPDDGNVETTDQFQHHDSGDEQEQAETGLTDIHQPEEHHPSSSEQDEAEIAVVPQPEEHQQLSYTIASGSRDVEESVTGDPHEISEGVYIDPPPAVLVSFESSDCPDICLFNQPARSRSPSPSSENHGPGYQVFDLLLHHRPILYYEPLASVFEALRQEEYLSRIPHLADSELVLDAYDLQLVISEDNFYAREVTLHDLNVLHDGSDITGPLRLRLRSVIPRFILRYHLLQDQVSRLNLAAAGDEQAQEQSDSHKQNNDEPQREEGQEDDAYENVSGSNDNPSGAPDLHSSPAEEDQHNTAQEESKVTAPEAETSAQYAEPHGADDGEGYGEKLQPEEVDDAETGDLPDPPEEEEDGEQEGEEGEEEEFVVVEAPRPKPIIPLTGAAAEDTGNDSVDRDESGPSNPHEDESETNVNEDATGALANNSVDPSVHNEPYEEGESFEEEEAQWEDAVDGAEDPDTTWEAEAEQETASNESSVTLSSKASKRSFDEIELEEDENTDSLSGAKRTRVD
ncbi:hypothetical protein B0H13DRAFT_1964736 [Mycena leptocephala]|nr:hypothetical protein B0H13DRAFT_1964736 [Mycena leptocephala]